MRTLGSHKVDLALLSLICFRHHHLHYHQHYHWHFYYDHQRLQYVGPRVIFVTILLLFEIHALPKAWAKDKMNQNSANRGHKVYILLVPSKYPPQKVDLIW